MVNIFIKRLLIIVSIILRKYKWLKNLIINKKLRRSFILVCIIILIIKDQRIPIFYVINIISGRLQ